MNVSLLVAALFTSDNDDPIRVKANWGLMCVVKEPADSTLKLEASKLCHQHLSPGALREHFYTLAGFSTTRRASPSLARPLGKMLHSGQARDVRQLNTRQEQLTHIFGQLNSTPFFGTPIGIPVDRDGSARSPARHVGREVVSSQPPPTFQAKR